MKPYFAINHCASVTFPLPTQGLFKKPLSITFAFVLMYILSLLQSQD